VERKQAAIRAESADEEALLQSYLTAPEMLKLFRLAYAWLDPNRWFADDNDRVGPYSTPASVLQGTRTGVRERILAVQALYPDRLHLLTNTLVTKVIVEEIKGAKPDEPQWKAVGVSYAEGKEANLYRATTPPEKWGKWFPKSMEKQIFVRRDHGEVILAGGAFNTPQLLMLSGIGPSDHLKEHKIEPRCHLPGVGRNLQDRYEVAVVAELPKDQEFKVLKGLTFRAPGDEDKPKDKPKGKAEEKPKGEAEDMPKDRGLE